MSNASPLSPLRWYRSVSFSFEHWSNHEYEGRSGNFRFLTDAVMVFYRGCANKGRFMWAKLMIDGLLKLKLEKDILQYLTNLPRDLASAYDAIYQGIHEQDSSAGEIADRVFQLIMCSERSFVLPTPETIARIFLSTWICTIQTPMKAR